MIIKQLNIKLFPNRIINIVLIKTVIILLSYSCATTKYVPEGERLLSKVEINNTAENVSKQELKSYLRQQENLKILGFWKLYLGVYNLSGRNDSKKFNNWLKRIGEEPVIFDSTLVDRSAAQMRLFLNNRGYYQAQVSDTILYPTRKKAKIVFNIKSGPRYQIKDVHYRVEDDSLKMTILNDSINSLLRPGRAFTINVHERERDRITRRLNNLGYFAFSNDYIHFNVDSAKSGIMISDTIIISKPINLQNVDLQHHAKYSIREVTFFVGGDPQDVMFERNTFNQYTDTIYFQGFRIIYGNSLDFRPNVLVNSNYINPGDLYRIDLVERTQQLLSSLRIFRFINIRFKEVEGTFDQNGNRQIDCFIHVIQGNVKSFRFDIEGTNSSGSIGAAGSYTFWHKNIFKGAELFSISARIARQDQFVKNSYFFNTMETGSDASIVFPKFLLPIRIERFRQRYNPYTNVSISYSYQRRPDYTRSIATARMGYSWRSSRHTFHNFSIFDFSLVNVPNVSEDFKNMIEATFLQNIYQDHLILNVNYSITYNQQVLGRNANFWFARFSFEPAGNLLNLIVPIVTQQQHENYYNLFGIRYAQYVKSEIDLKFHQRINRLTSVNYRIFTGVGLPYGNFDILPFEKRYFSGGAFSLRAWPVRGIGPGFVNNTSARFYNQTADIKLEGNIEYRFRLFWILEGAFFLDAGNIWDIRKHNAREEGLFKFDDFYKQIAIGTGFGTRFDFNFFIFRIDFGLKLQDPTVPQGERWRPKSGYNNNDFAFNFAVGYPF